jgi:uroporphyrinogen decarboxylase
MHYKNDIFLKVVRGEEVPRPPVWLMRQAGRILPQYRELRASLKDFKELVETPDKAAEVTIQPIDELGVDAAIIFSDILVIPEALGLPYQMEEKQGPFFPKVISSASDIESLYSAEDAEARLQYVYDAIKITVKHLDGRVPLIGFCGAPWTILAYMIEGKGSKTFSQAKKFLYTEPLLAEKLLDKITDASILYLKQQVNAGAAHLQIFDSWAGLLSSEQYAQFSTKYIGRICSAIKGTGITVFAKGAMNALDDFAKLDCEVIGLDWTMEPDFARTKVGDHMVFQGNLDPCVLYASPESIRGYTIDMISRFGKKHIANLGHGVYPDTPLDNVKIFVNTVKEFKYNT